MASAITVYGIEDDLLDIHGGVQGLFILLEKTIDAGINIDTPAYVYSEDGEQLMALEI